MRSVADDGKGLALDQAPQRQSALLQRYLAVLMSFLVEAFTHQHLCPWRCPACESDASPSQEGANESPWDMVELQHHPHLTGLKHAFIQPRQCCLSGSKSSKVMLYIPSPECRCCYPSAYRCEIHAIHTNKIRPSFYRF